MELLGIQPRRIHQRLDANKRHDKTENRLAVDQTSKHLHAAGKIIFGRELMQCEQMRRGRGVEEQS